MQHIAKFFTNIQEIKLSFDFYHSRSLSIKYKRVRLLFFYFRKTLIIINFLSTFILLISRSINKECILIIHGSLYHFFFPSKYLWYYSLFRRNVYDVTKWNVVKYSWAVTYIQPQFFFSPRMNQKWIYRYATRDKIHRPSRAKEWDLSDFLVRWNKEQISLAYIYIL